MARAIGTFTAHTDGIQPITGEVRFYFYFRILSSFAFIKDVFATKI